MVRYYKEGNLRSAIYMGEKAIEILKKDKKNKTDYTSVLNNLAYIYFENNNYLKAEKAYKEVLENIEPILGKEDKITANVKNYIGIIYLKTFRYNEAEYFIREAKRVREKLLPENDKDVIQSFRNMKDLCVARGDYEDAFKYQDTVINKVFNEHGEYNSFYLNMLNEKALIYQAQGDFKNAVKMLESVISKEAKINGEYNETYIRYMQNLAEVYQNINNYEAALKILKKIIVNIEIKFKKKIKYADCKNQIGNLYVKVKKYDEAMNCYNEAEKIIKKILGTNNANYALVLNNKAFWFYSKGYYKKAKKIFLKVKKIQKTVIGEKHYDYANTITGLALIYFETEKYKNAETLFLQALAIYEDASNENKIGYFELLTNIATYYETIGFYYLAEEYYLKALDVGKKKLGTSNLKYAKLLSRVANYLKISGKYEIADSLYKKSINMQIKICGKKHTDYVRNLNNIGAFYFTVYKYDKAEKIMLESAKIQSNMFGEKHIYYNVAINNLALLYFDMNKMSECEIYMKKVNNNLIDYMNNNISYITDFKKEAFNYSADYLFDINYSFYYTRYKKQSRYSEDAYNLFLSRKKFTMQLEEELKRKIKKLNDSAVNIDFFEYMKTKSKLGEIYSIPEKYDKTKISKLEKKSYSLEEKLINISPNFKKYKSDKSINWKKIKNKLKKGNAIIEFVKFEYYNPEKTDSIFYIAFIMRNKYKSPKMVYMFEENEINSIIQKKDNISQKDYINTLYSKNKKIKPINAKGLILDSLIWKPLEKYLQNVDTIYISTTGILQKIPFAALKINDSTFVSDKYILNTINSSIELFKNKEEKKLENISVAIYGGIDYNAIPEISDELNDINNNSIFLDNNKYLPSLPIEDKEWDLIDETLIEVKNINKFLKQKNVDVYTFFDDKASEESIKQYSGNKKSPNFIYISTAGYFFSKKNNLYENLTFSERINKFKTAHNPFLQTGLLFAGANRTINDKKMPKEIEDGILSAYEIKKLNLDSTEVVAISLNNGSLSDINYNNKIFNLQRAFKIAGANYIITTLWQVPNKQKTDFIKAFYKYKKYGFDTKKAFWKVQENMKTRYSPYYWAAFLLIN